MENTNETVGTCNPSIVVAGRLNTDQYRKRPTDVTTVRPRGATFVVVRRRRETLNLPHTRPSAHRPFRRLPSRRSGAIPRLVHVGFWLLLRLHLHLFFFTRTVDVDVVKCRVFRNASPQLYCASRNHPRVLTYKNF